MRKFLQSQLVDMSIKRASRGLFIVAKNINTLCFTLYVKAFSKESIGDETIPFKEKEPILRAFNVCGEPS